MKKSTLQNDRRTFIKQTTLATTGILSASVPVKSFANVLDNKKLKLALPHGPADGEEGLEKNETLVARARQLVGRDGEIMLDGSPLAAPVERDEAALATSSEQAG